MRQQWTKLLAMLLLGVAGTSAQTQLQTGYTLLTAQPGSPAPAGAALFSYSNSAGVLLSEAGVAAAEPTMSGRVFVDQRGAETGFALANTSTENATVTLTLRDATGRRLDSREISLGPRRHSAGFISELFPSVPETGSLTFESTRPLAAITLRQGRNGYNESVYTTLPVVSLNAPLAAQPITFPHVAVGGAYSAQLLLMNRSSQTMRGSIQFTASDGGPLLVRMAGTAMRELSYEIPPEGIYRAELTGGIDVTTGYAVVTPGAGTNTPSGTLIFRFTSGNDLTEAGVAAVTATSSGRIYVDNFGTRTGLALANPGDQDVEVTFTLMDRFGAVEATEKRKLAPQGHRAIFVDELFARAADYTGQLEISSTSSIVPIALKMTRNSRQIDVLTSLPVADLQAAPAGGTVVFPHLAIGDGFATRLILLNANTTAGSDGQMAFYDSNGALMSVRLAGGIGNQFRYQISPGGGRQYYPGDTARVSEVSLNGTEVVINEGNRVHPALKIVDSNNRRRDDFDALIVSLDTTIAEVDAFGGILGKKPGFSTLTITAGGVPAVATAVVVGVNSAVGGFQPTSISQDPAGRLYMTSASEHVVLRADKLGQPPQRYAGVSNRKGFNNGLRLEALFDRPSFLAKHLGMEKSLYVSDAANNAIRKIGDAPDGRVETLAGGGGPGNQDGPAAAATFNNPQGVALDSRGYLWVADSGNHTIRRINLVNRTVETIAGRPGVAAFADGRGRDALFNEPSGIAVEIETAAQQLQRAIRKDGPAPVTVIVADTKNGLLRRVSETGEVQTINEIGNAAVTASLQNRSAAVSAAAATAARFVSPFAVAVDTAGNIFVTESGTAGVTAVLQTGEIVPAVQPGTLARATGIAAVPNGKLVVAADALGAVELSYGQPQVTSVEPNRWRNNPGQLVTLRGHNFARDTLVIVGGVLINERRIEDTQKITFVAPDLPSGRQPVIIFNRGGAAQLPVTVDPVPLSELPVGYVSTLAGGSTFAGEGGRATDTSVGPVGITVDIHGNVFFTDGVNRKVRRVDARTGILTTVAGSGQEYGDQDSGKAFTAAIPNPTAVTFDRSGNLLIADEGIHKVDVRTGDITLIVSGDYGFRDNVDALSAAFNYIAGIAVDAEGAIFIADRYNHRIRRVDPVTGMVTTIAGNGKTGPSAENIPATEAALNQPFAVAVDDLRKVLYVAELGTDGPDHLYDRVRRIDLRTNRITTLVAHGDDLTSNPTGLAVDAAGDLYISVRGRGRVRKLEIVTGRFTTVAGSDGIPTGGDGGPATNAALKDPFGLAIDAAGNIFIADYYDYAVRRVDGVTGIITTFAGNRQPAIVEDDVPAAAATLRYPVSVTADGTSLYINDKGHGLIRKMDTQTGMITTVAGGGSVETYKADGVPATQALIRAQGRVAVDQSGNLYIAVQYRIFKIDSRSGIISTIAGNGTDRDSGDATLAKNAAVLPDDIGIDSNVSLYFAENATQRVRRVDLFSGTIETVAGGDGTLGSSLRIAVHPGGDVYIADIDNRLVWKMDAQTRAITTVAGGGVSYQDGQRATTVKIYPGAVDVDSAGNLYIVDLAGIRKVSVGTGIITTIAGGRAQWGRLGDNGPATDAFFLYPQGVTVDTSGNLFVADTQNNRIRAIRGPIQ